MRQLKLKGGVKAGCYRLLLAKLGSARSIALGRREAQRFAGQRGITYQAEPPNGREIFEANRRRRRAGRAQD
jgi:hypothetical protein